MFISLINSPYGHIQVAVVLSRINWKIESHKVQPVLLQSTQPAI
jgi:hypothetical protein